MAPTLDVVLVLFNFKNLCVPSTVRGAGAPVSPRESFPSPGEPASCWSAAPPERESVAHSPDCGC